MREKRGKPGLDPVEKKWFAVYTRYKREKIVVKRLSEKNIHAYVPLQEFTRYYTRKIKKVKLPLISCYVFVKITEAEYISVLETTDVVQFIKFNKELIPIPESSIKVLRQITGEGIEIELSQGHIQLGQKAEIVGGRLTGLVGKVVEKRGEKNFIIELDALRYNLHLQVPKQYLRMLAGNS